MRLRLVLLSLLNAACPSAKEHVGPPPIESSELASVEDAKIAPKVPSPRRPLDVTFLVSSDAHFGVERIEDVHERIARRMNLIDRGGVAYPRSIGGGAVATPRGLIVTGDLTEWGREEEWARFAAWYGRDGTDGHVRFPVFEMIGNHDGALGTFVRDRVIERHDGGVVSRRGGGFYAFDFDDLHLIALGEAPDEEGLAFVERDLERLTAIATTATETTKVEPPIVLFFHLPLAGAFATGHWFGDGAFRDRLWAILEGHNVVGIFHGHHHARGHYKWHGIDVYKPGAAKDGAHTFAVVHVTSNRMRVAWRDADSDVWVDAHAKPISKAATP